MHLRYDGRVRAKCTVYSSFSNPTHLKSVWFFFISYFCRYAWDEATEGRQAETPQNVQQLAQLGVNEPIVAMDVVSVLLQELANPALEYIRHLPSRAACIFDHYPLHVLLTIVCCMRCCTISVQSITDHTVRLSSTMPIVYLLHAFWPLRCMHCGQCRLSACCMHFGSRCATCIVNRVGCTHCRPRSGSTCPRAPRRSEWRSFWTLPPCTFVNYSPRSRDSYCCFRVAIQGTRIICHRRIQRVDARGVHTVCRLPGQTRAPITLDTHQPLSQVPPFEKHIPDSAAWGLACTNNGVALCWSFGKGLGTQIDLVFR